jgi:hypothetical protein
VMIDAQPVGAWDGRTGRWSRRVLRGVDTEVTSGM